MQLHFFSVTAEDINAGVPRDVYRCPVVIALKRSRPSLEASFLHNDMPRAILEFLWSFDRGLSVEPEGFWIDLDAAVEDFPSGSLRKLRDEP